MNQEQVLSIVRALLQIAGTVLVSRGFMTETDWTTIAGGVVMAVPVIWSMYVHMKSTQIATVAAMPDVKKVVTSPAIANGSLAADPKVVTQ